MQAFAVFQLFIAVVYFAICIAALSSDSRYFIPEVRKCLSHHSVTYVLFSHKSNFQIFGIQIVFAITFLISPILGLIAVAKNSPETAFWHAMLSASGIALAIAGRFILYIFQL